jgi:uncharacterized protein YbaA (DUF1428 family)
MNGLVLLMSYVDGFVLVVPKNKVAAYKKMAVAGSKIWKRLGALQYFECIGDDLNPDTHGMKILGFPKMTKLKKNETVWFSFIIYKSRAHRDAVNKKMMQEMEKEYKGKEDMPMPWDMKRMAFGGFRVVVEK